MVCAVVLFIVIRIAIQVVQQDRLTLIAVDRLDVFKQIHAVWAISFILSVLTILVLFRFSSKRTVLFVIIPMLVFIDVRYYASDPLATRIGKVNPSSRIYISGLTDKMVINYQTLQLGYQHLNANYNSPFGDSQFLPKAYLKKFEGYGFNSKLKGLKGNEVIDKLLVENIGLEFVVSRDGKILKAEDLGSVLTCQH